MNRGKHFRLSIVVLLFVAAVSGLAVMRHSDLLLISGILTGALFLALARSRGGASADEREVSVREKAAQTTYAIFAPTLAIGAFVLLACSGDYPYLEALGMVFTYLTLFLIVIYALSYFFINRRFGGGADEE